MCRPLLAATALVLTLGGCSTNLNPFNWFGPSRATPAATASADNPLIPRRRISIFRSNDEKPEPGPPIDTVEALEVERIPGGAIIRATGLAAQPGAWDAVLIPETVDDAGTLAYSFRARKNPNIRGTGRKLAREVTVARYLTDNQLAGIRAITVAGARNLRSVRR